MIAAHRNNRAAATLLLHRRAHSNSVVLLSPELRVERILERPSEAERSGLAADQWVNSGVYLFQPSILEAIPREGASDFPRDIFPGLVRTGGVYGFPLTGYRCAIDSQERLEQARADLAATLWPSKKEGP